MSMKFDPAQLSLWLGAVSEEISRKINVSKVERTDDLFEFHIDMPDETQFNIISTEGADAALSAALISILYRLGYEVSVCRN